MSGYKIFFLQYSEDKFQNIWSNDCIEEENIMIPKVTILKNTRPGFFIYDTEYKQPKPNQANSLIILCSLCA